jgi:hypothetical protein
MKIFHSRNFWRGGHTLVEMMFALGILVVVVGALLAANYVGITQSQWVESKCGASDSSRRMLNQFPVDVKSSKMWFLGSISGTNFVLNTNSSQGTAVELFQTTNGSQGIIYYFDLSNTNNNDGHLLRTASTNWNPVIVCSNLVNWLGNGYTFNLEDYAGNPATNGANNTSYKCIIHLDLQFCLFRYPLTAVGTNGLYDYYKIEFRATPHLPE